MKILVSIDTEGPAGKDPIQRLVYGKTAKGSEYGIRFLMDLLDEFDVRGLFFVDIAQAWDCGKRQIAGVLKDIRECGHDTGVHVHPDHMGDPKRKYLWQYNKKEQYEIIAKCTDLYEKALKEPPISFRAGKYGANNDTLDIIKELGYQYDMSVFYGNRFCRIDPPITWNRVTFKDGLTEIPVTSFKSLNIPFLTRYDKVDGEMMFLEFKRVLRVIDKTQGVDVLSLFLHSFSLLDWRRNPDSPQYRPMACRRLKNMLGYLPQKQFISQMELGSLVPGNWGDMGELDISSGVAPYFYFAQRAAKVLRNRMIRNV